MALNETVQIEKEAFHFDNGGYTFIASYLLEPHSGDALIQIFRDKALIKEFLFPAYKIWNIAAHADDIIAGLNKGNDEGLYIAGSNGLGGNSYQG